VCAVVVADLRLRAGTETEGKLIPCLLFDIATWTGRHHFGPHPLLHEQIGGDLARDRSLKGKDHGLQPEAGNSGPDRKAGDAGSADSHDTSVSRRGSTSHSCDKVN
jgi:hypothetical protein